MIHSLDDSFSQLNKYIDTKKPSKIFILVDENTHTHCLPTLLGNLETTANFEILEIEAGEEMKNINSAVSLWEILLEYEADRNALLINLGGGVVTDLGGFVASTFKRGIDFVNIPTTLLAMVDASIGGKTGIDLGYSKNIIGTFSLPENIFINTNFLKTLPSEHIFSGLAEMLKHGLVLDASHWSNLTDIEDFTEDNISKFIFYSSNLKNAIIQKDIQEKGERKLLNFGHTIGHAIESLHLENGKPILHGFAIAIGMYWEAKMSMNAGILPITDFKEIEKQLVRIYDFIPNTEYPLETLLPFMKHDKKNENLEIGFVAIEKIGKAKYNWLLNYEEIKKYIDKLIYRKT